MFKYIGMEVVCQIGFEDMFLVIFLIVYNEYVVQVFEVYVVDYLLKFFDYN